SVTPNLPDTSLTSIEKLGLEFEVLSDIGCKVASEFGLVFTLPERLRPVYAQFGIDIPGENGEDTFFLPMPATYVVESSGQILFSFADADYTKRAEPQEVVEVLRGMRG
ncbi:MAG: AhpC/TSA family protein, partial [Nitrospinota bacterium]